MGGKGAPRKHAWAPDILYGMGGKGALENMRGHLTYGMGGKGALENMRGQAGKGPAKTCVGSGPIGTRRPPPARAQT